MQLGQNRNKKRLRTNPTGRVEIQDTTKIITFLICVYGQEGYIAGQEDCNHY